MGNSTLNIRRVSIREREKSLAKGRDTFWKHAPSTRTGGGVRVDVSDYRNVKGSRRKRVFLMRKNLKEGGKRG